MYVMLSAGQNVKPTVTCDKYVTLVTGQGEGFIHAEVGKHLQHLMDHSHLVAHFESDRPRGAWRVWLLPPQSPTGLLILLSCSLLCLSPASSPDSRDALLPKQLSISGTPESRSRQKYVVWDNPVYRRTLFQRIVAERFGNSNIRP